MHVAQVPTTAASSTHLNGTTAASSTQLNGTTAASNTHLNGTTTASSTQLSGKVALITGAGRGIGAGFALELASRGASVVVNYGNSAKGATEVVKQIQAMGSAAIAIQADVSKVPEITRLFNEAIAHFGHLDIVINNAGIEAFYPEPAVTEEIYDRTFNINTRAQFFVAQHAYRHLRVGGRIIFMSSVAAPMTGIRNHALYAGSKCAVEGFTRSFAKDCGDKLITVNAVAPGGVYTDMFVANAWHYTPGADENTPVDELEKGLASINPLGRVARPVDIAQVVAFLSGPDSAFINGQVITINGGGV